MNKAISKLSNTLHEAGEHKAASILLYYLASANTDTLEATVTAAAAALRNKGVKA